MGFYAFIRVKFIGDFVDWTDWYGESRRILIFRDSSLFGLDIAENIYVVLY